MSEDNKGIEYHLTRTMLPEKSNDDSLLVKLRIEIARRDTVENTITSTPLLEMCFPRSILNSLTSQGCKTPTAVFSSHFDALVELIDYYISNYLDMTLENLYADLLTPGDGKLQTFRPQKLASCPGLWGLRVCNKTLYHTGILTEYRYLMELLAEIVLRYLDERNTPF